MTDVTSATKSVATSGPQRLRPLATSKTRKKQKKLELWANAQRDGRPAEYRWRPLFIAAKFG